MGNNHLHPKGDGGLSYIKDLDAKGLLVKSNKTTATFDLDLADWLDYTSLADKKLTVFVDKKATIGTAKIPIWEQKYIKQQFKRIDDITGFEIKYAYNSKKADVALTKFKNISKDIDNAEGPGFWDPGDSSELGLQSIVWEQSNTGNRKLDKFDTKTTISHEIGHMLGLQHPVTEFFDDHPNTIMGGDELVEKDGPYLTKYDLDLLSKGWDTYWSNPNIYG
tara:strand:- start:58 stop:720 length:663 start_codon:yes stop_codon:yes gene_type:complete